MAVLAKKARVQRIDRKGRGKRQRREGKADNHASASP
jgi:hypothetical protein